jgi:D-amino-acid dehydrogenase
LRLEYEHRSGYLVLLRTRKDLAMVEPGLATLSALGIRFEQIDAARCLDIEPGLCTDTALHAGVHLPDDEVGNCRQFAMLLRKQAERIGARFRFNTTVERIEPASKPRLVLRRAPHTPSTRTATASPSDGADDWPDTEPLVPDRRLRNSTRSSSARRSAPCRCCGRSACACRCRRSMGTRSPRRCARGRSDFGPRSALMDERYKVAISRIGNRIRVAGSAELGGSPTSTIRARWRRCTRC